MTIMHTRRNRFVLSVAVALIVGCQQKTTPLVVRTSATVTIEINSGGTTDSFQIENVATGTTLESLMRSFKAVPVTIHGSGVTAFVDGIGGKATSGSEGWTFQVDGEFARQGIGSTTLTPPARITWSYGDSSEIVAE